LERSGVGPIRQGTLNEALGLSFSLGEGCDALEDELATGLNEDFER